MNKAQLKTSRSERSRRNTIRNARKVVSAKRRIVKSEAGIAKIQALIDRLGIPKKFDELTVVSSRKCDRKLRGIAAYQVNGETQYMPFEVIKKDNRHSKYCPICAE